MRVAFIGNCMHREGPCRRDGENSTNHPTRSSRLPGETAWTAPDIVSPFPPARRGDSRPRPTRLHRTAPTVIVIAFVTARIVCGAAGRRTMPAKNRRSQGQAARSRDESSAGREEQAFERVVADSRGHRSPIRPPTRRSVDVDASEASRAGSCPQPANRSMSTLTHFVGACAGVVDSC